MVLRKSYILITATMIFSSCGTEMEDENPVVNELPGKAIYDVNCVACHGKDGALGAGGASDLTLSTLESDSIKYILKNGRNNMLPQTHAFKSEEQLNELVEYLESMRY